jgi:Eukaryotic aspartyl protease
VTSGLVEQQFVIPLTMIEVPGTQLEYCVTQSATQPKCITTPKPAGFNNTFGTLTGPNSTSLNILKQGGFAAIYGDGEIVTGDLVTDTLVLGGVTFNKFEFGFAHAGGAPKAISAAPLVGIAGVSYQSAEALALATNQTSSYPTLLSQMVTQGVIGTQAFSLYLNDISKDCPECCF